MLIDSGIQHLIQLLLLHKLYLKMEPHILPSEIVKKIKEEEFQDESALLNRKRKKWPWLVGISAVILVGSQSMHVISLTSKDSVWKVVYDVSHFL
ncbi:hypothetical protein [Jeotgalibacillus soli]|uniref:Uncharacterized protein n=1 Tax=Jeotgalibacillus soli TaxID=889306 RepID=A0A0C2RLH3_9BACL|nr:hypothetical protein [Jeotgalibacillus soli]KIL42584.1 hypothetical protein KP78_38070 [Jeotgalibacillus soli]